MDEKKVDYKLIEIYENDFAHFVNILPKEQARFFIRPQSGEENKIGYFLYEKYTFCGYTIFFKTDNVWILDDLFILPKFKNQGLDLLLLFMLMERHKGIWVIRQIEKDVEKKEYWCNCLKKLKIDYTESVFQDENWGNLTCQTIEIK